MTDERSARDLSFTLGVDMARDPQAPVSAEHDADDAVGISNRESAEEERAEREAHPPTAGGSPAPEDATGTVGDEPIEDYSGLQTAHKAGSRSIAQKENAAKYPDRSMPATRKVPGAFAKEPSPAAEPDKPE
jgi:hypothetical protein